MKTAALPAATPSLVPGPSSQLRWWSMVAIGLSQLMVVLDSTIMNVALPSAQAELGFGDTVRPWLITSYALAFGGLLLLGGRIADLAGRKQIFVTGLLGFAVASALGGAAPTVEVLLLARALQGIFAALLVPAALSLLTTTFTDPAERGKAFGIYGALAGAGSAVGLLLGGVLTDTLSWRWTLYINIVFAVAALVVGAVAIAPTPRQRGVRLDVPGAVLATAGFFALVGGLSMAEEHGFAEPLSWGGLVAGGVLLLAFVARQARGAYPLLPLRIVTDRDRGASLLAIFVAGMVVFGVNLFLVYYLQLVRGFSPLQTGLAMLPFCVGITLAALLTTSRFLPRLGAKLVVPSGMLLAAVGAALLLLAREGGSFTLQVGIPSFIVAFGLGAVISTAVSAGTLGVAPHDSGAASAAVNAANQLGGSLGLAALNALVATTTVAALGAGLPATQALLQGYSSAYLACVVALLLGALGTALLFRRHTSPRR